MSRVHLSPPEIGDEEWSFIADALDSNWIAPLGPHVDQFEAELAAVCQVGHAAALSSGTAALHLALILAGVRRNDAVLCSTLTFVASANPIRYLGARPVFVDVDDSTWTLDPDLLEDELSRRASRNRLPAAVIAVDLYGQCADFARIEPLCRKYAVPLIEDAAESLGSIAFGRPAGSFGDVAALSFNGNKIITTSGGGALLSQNAEAVDKARFLASQARDPAPHYEHSEMGFNYRLSNLLAALGRAQLRRLDEKVAARRAIFERYRSGLDDLPGITFMPEAPFGRSNRWLTVLTVDPGLFGIDREQVRIALDECGIESRPVWKPMHLQPVFQGCDTVGGDTAALLFERGLCLPSGSGMTFGQVDRTVEIIQSLAPHDG